MIFLRELLELRERCHTGVREEDIEARAVAFDRCEQPLEIGGLRDVAGDGGHVAADRGHGLVQLVLSTSGDEDVRPLLEESRGGGATDPVRAAPGDDCGLALEPVHFSTLHRIPHRSVLN